MSRKPTNGRLYENCRAVAADVARRPTSGRRDDNAACGCVAPCHARGVRREARRADRWSAALNPGASAADVSRQPTNGRLYENCRAIAAGVPRQPASGQRSAVGAKTMRRADAWRHAMPARFAARTVEPTVGRLLSTEVPPQPTCHGSRPTVGSTKIVMPWRRTCHGSRPTVGSTKLWCRGSRRGTAADQRSALPRGVVSAAA